MTEEEFEEVKARMQPQMLRFGSPWSYVVLSVAGWLASGHIRLDMRIDMEIAVP